MLFALAIICFLGWSVVNNTHAATRRFGGPRHCKEESSHPQEIARNVILDPSNNRDDTWDGQSFDGGDVIAP